MSLMDGLVRDVSKLYVLSNTPGAIYKDLLILGTRVSEGPGPAAPGHIRAYDVRTGKIRWTFHTIPQPGEFGYDTWPSDAYTRVGAANAWSGISVDKERGLVFLPTGSAAFDFWGGNRHGANLFANCLLALKADTGNASGTSRRSITTCGTATFLPRQCWSTFNTTARSRRRGAGVEIRRPVPFQSRDR